MKILVINGPNMGTLGRRNTAVYGTLSLAALNSIVKRRALELGLRPLFFQSNCEGAIIDFIEKHSPSARAILINPAAYTHYSVAIRDALEASLLPAVEVHLSDISRREPFRRKSITGGVCRAMFKGRGAQSYLDGLEFISALLAAGSGDENTGRGKKR